MKQKGFTIIELITVIAIIATIVGLMTPAIRKAREVAARLKQRAQLRALEVGLEGWANDHDFEYPDSTRRGSSLRTTGAHHLAEALIGRDAHGFDDQSSWNAEADEADTEIYLINPGNYHNRRQPYVESDDSDFAQIAQIYENYDIGTGSPYPGDYNEELAVTGHNQAVLFTDVFARKSIKSFTKEGDTFTKKVGMPILYYRAKDTDTFDSDLPTTSIFNYEDNEDIMRMGHNRTGENHPFYSTSENYDVSGEQECVDKFYDWLINPSYRSGKVPYNKDTFLLLSAGPDGLYGTKDDVHNMSGKE